MVFNYKIHQTTLTLQSSPNTNVHYMLYLLLSAEIKLQRGKLISEYISCISACSFQIDLLFLRNYLVFHSLFVLILIKPNLNLLLVTGLALIHVSSQFYQSQQFQFLGIEHSDYDQSFLTRKKCTINKQINPKFNQINSKK